jgi:hypothetical protein
MLNMSDICYCEQMSAWAPNLGELFELADFSLSASSLLYHPPSLGTRQGFLKSWLCSGKALWPAANMPYNSTNPLMEREDLQNDQAENRKIKWADGGRGEQEGLGKGSAVL